MAMVNFKSFSIPGADTVRDTIAGFFVKDQVDGEVVEVAQVAPQHSGTVLERLARLNAEKTHRYSAAMPVDVQTGEPRVDQIRYEQMLERELDRQLMSEVEREDSDMLMRVRDALYADD